MGKSDVVHTGARHYSIASKELPRIVAQQQFGE